MPRAEAKRIVFVRCHRGRNSTRAERATPVTLKAIRIGPGFAGSASGARARAGTPGRAVPAARRSASAGPARRGS